MLRSEFEKLKAEMKAEFEVAEAEGKEKIEKGKE
jgi:hypothetical protein